VEPIYTHAIYPTGFQNPELNPVTTQEIQNPKLNPVKTQEIQNGRPPNGAVSLELRVRG
jgi:hypothetical protein